MKPKKSKRLWLFVLAAVILLLVAYGLVPQATTVDAQSVASSAMEVVIEEEGQTRVIDRFVVTAPVSGFGRRLALKAGDPVEKGATVAYIEPMRVEALNPQRRAEAEARVLAARSALRSAQESVGAAEADAILANAELQRTRELLAADAATQRDVDFAAAQARRSEAQKASAEFGVEVSRHNLEAAETALRFAGAAGGGQAISVKSPIAGRVLAVHHESEGVVGPGTPLLEIGDPARLEVADATRIQPGMAVRFQRWGGDGDTLHGEVRTVQPAGFTKVSALGVEEQRVWIVVDFVSDPHLWSKLGDRYRVIAEFITWESDSALQVPSSALFRRGEGWATFVVDGGRAVEREVTVGRRNGLSAQVLGGLAEGELVIVHPASDLKDGAKVKVR